MVCRDFRQTTPHGAIEGKTQTKSVRHYNLDVIISVGYRVKSLRGTQFRIWAKNRLRKPSGISSNRPKGNSKRSKPAELRTARLFLEVDCWKWLLRLNSNQPPIRNSPKEVANTYKKNSRNSASAL